VKKLIYSEADVFVLVSFLYLSLIIILKGKFNFTHGEKALCGKLLPKFGFIIFGNDLNISKF